MFEKFFKKEKDKTVEETDWEYFYCKECGENFQSPEGCNHSGSSKTKKYAEDEDKYFELVRGTGGKI